VKVYELKKGDKIIVDNEILEFEEIRGDEAIFYNEWGIEIKYPDYYDVEEIGTFNNIEEHKEILPPSLF
jgi:hypothetical protein